MCSTSCLEQEHTLDLHPEHMCCFRQMSLGAVVVTFTVASTCCRESAAAASPLSPEPTAADKQIQESQPDSSQAPQAGSDPATTSAGGVGTTAAAAAAGIAPPQPVPSPAASVADLPEPEHRTVAWVLNSCLVLIGSRALGYSELKKHMLQSIIIIITATGAKYNEPLLFMRIMVRNDTWLIHKHADSSASCSQSSMAQSACVLAYYLHTCQLSPLTFCTDICVICHLCTYIELGTGWVMLVVAAVSCLACITWQFTPYWCRVCGASLSPD